MLLLAIYNLDFGFGALNIIIIHIIILNPSFKLEGFFILTIFSVGCSVVSYKKQKTKKHIEQHRHTIQ